MDQDAFRHYQRTADEMRDLSRDFRNNLRSNDLFGWPPTPISVGLYLPSTSATDVARELIALDSEYRTVAPWLTIDSVTMFGFPGAPFFATAMLPPASGSIEVVSAEQGNSLDLILAVGGDILSAIGAWPVLMQWGSAVVRGVTSRITGRGRGGEVVSQVVATPYGQRADAPLSPRAIEASRITRRQTFTYADGSSLVSEEFALTGDDFR